MDNPVGTLVDFVSAYYDVALAVVGAAAAIATLTPNKADDAWVQKILDLVNFLGLNIGKAKNDPNSK